MSKGFFLMVGGGLDKKIPSLLICFWPAWKCLHSCWTVQLGLARSAFTLSVKNGLDTLMFCKRLRCCMPFMVYQAYKSVIKRVKSSTVVSIMRKNKYLLLYRVLKLVIYLSDIWDAFILKKGQRLSISY